MEVPKIIERQAQAYVAIAARVAMDKVSTIADKLPGELFAWLGQRKLVPAGAPFFRYNAILKNGDLELEWGVPLATRQAGEGRVIEGVLPAGKFASVMHVGPYSGIPAEKDRLIAWIAEQGLERDMNETSNGRTFGCWVEFYPTDPRSEPDKSKWLCEIVMRLADRSR